ncbi:MAG: alpha/beta hydrolase, partial [Pseudomonadota bacterium]
AVHSAREYADGTYGFRYDPGISISFKGREIKDVDLWEWWDKVSVSTLILRGSDSDVLNAETAAQMQVRGPKARIVELTGVGHAPMIMDNQQIEIVRGFIIATD